LFQSISSVVYRNVELKEPERNPVSVVVGMF